ncbi:MAG: hypothetical protein KF716_08145 [Anaerolineae bacterium]|nr:hypothetical protein [Anaerolineae bacterium]
MPSHLSLDLLSTTTVEGLIIEKYPRNLTIFRALDKRRVTVDALVDAFHEHDRAAYAETGHARSVIDMRVSGWPSAYGISVFAFDSVHNTPCDLVESFAFVMADGFAARMMAVMLGDFIPKVRTASKIFFDESEALHWLRERDYDLTPRRHHDAPTKVG